MRSQTLMTTLMSCSMSNTVKPLIADRADQVAELTLLGRIETGGRFVEQEDLRLGGHGARNLEPALEAVGQVARRVVGLCRDAHELE